MVVVQTRFNTTGLSLELLEWMGCDYIPALGKAKLTSFVAGYLGSSALELFL